MSPLNARGFFDFSDGGRFRDFREGKVTLSTSEKNSQRTPADKNKTLEAVLRSHQTRIRVVGCGGGGNNTISRLMEVGVKNIETLAINTDAQDLLAAKADDKILIGQNITKGLGAGSNPQIGEDSARENQQEIEEALQNADLVVVTCGLGGGTGTGSIPIVAEVAKKVGALTISIVTLPFTEEGISRWENAQSGLEKLRKNSDTVIVIQNDRLLEVVPDLPLDTAFKVADEILVNAVKGITELITEKGLVNLDFADVRTIMQNGGTAMIGIGESEGAESAQAAVEMAMQNKLLDLDITGAKNALINITGGAQMPLKDAKMVMKIVAAKLDPSAKIIWGARIDQNVGKTIRVMLIATGLQEKRNGVFAFEEKAKTTELAKRPAPAEEKVAQKNAVAPLEKLSSEKDTIVPKVSSKDDTAETRSPRDAESGPNERMAPQRKVKSPFTKPRKRSKILIADKQLLKLVEASKSPAVTPAVNGGKVSHETKPDNTTTKPAEAKKIILNAATGSVASEIISPSPATNIELTKSPETTPSGGITPQPSAAAIASDSEKRIATVDMGEAAHSEKNIARQDLEWKLQPREQTAIARPPVVNGIKTPTSGSLSERTDQTARMGGAPPAKTGAYNKIFAEQSHVHLQIIRESIGHLFVDPTRQEVLRRIKHAAIAINNLARRFVFDVIAAYAATIEEICERVLDGEINMSKKLVNAFTEIPAIFDSMLNGDLDAFVEAKRHQERLQRLADSFVDGEVVNMDMENMRSAAVNPAARVSTAATFISKSAPAPNAPPTAVSPIERRPRPATEVMEYLDDLLARGKKPSRP
jgi:cell division protein FtsZ